MSDRRHGARGRDDRDRRDVKVDRDSREHRNSFGAGDRERNRRDASPRTNGGSFGGMGGPMGGGRGGPGGATRGRDMNGQAFTESELMSDLPKKKFTGRCRLFVGNLPNEVKEQELKDLFSPHGDIAECYLSGKGFAFLRLDTRAHAESAKEAIDGRIIHGRQVRVRFAVHGAALRVKELSATVSNEMLYHAFSHFGDVERAVHIVDEKGRPTGEGIVEFERKPSANEAITSIKERVFLLTANPKPLLVDLLEPRDEDDGLAERMIPRTPQLVKERELGPRFPNPNTFEYVYGIKWKELYETERRRKEALEEELREARKRLEADMELAYQDYQAQMLREDLQRRQQELERLEAQRRARMGLGGPPQAMPSHQQPPQQMYGAPQHDMGGMYGAPPPAPFGGMGGAPQHHQFAAPPPQHQHSGGMQQVPGRGGPPGAPAGGQQNVMEGVQRLLQIFKSDGGRGDGPGQGGHHGHQQQQPAPFGGGFPGGHPDQQHFGGPPQQQFNRPHGGPGDYPPEKRRR